jgi:hypothetical protein
MCQTAVERLFDRVWPSHIRKVASLFAQALSLGREGVGGLEVRELWLYPTRYFTGRTIMTGQ